ncbi:hypothetical protein F5144DRAFT_499234 [Chaetomium tenue]|uniref:Uncharacterized protein n=1 Tax=Chaetomium tenue TaxID=1854479 RepID=A0ACB7NXN4_9PEZI|nr:hypothetical protein F5144DRAFT_499234 [Chaetomium globosum]
MAGEDSPKTEYRRTPVMYKPPGGEATIYTLTTFHGILCATTEQLLRVSNQWINSKRGAKRREKKKNKKKRTRNNDWNDDKDSRHTGVVCYKQYALQSLYKALIAITNCADYDGEDSTTVGRFPVYLVRTGVEDDLSAPFSFDTEVAAQKMKYVSENVVETNLEAAVDFIMALEGRETAVFGIQPDPASIMEPPRDEKGRKLTTLPNTQWVSDEKAAEWGWCGQGQWFDEVVGFANERMELDDYKELLLQMQMRKEGDNGPYR